MSVAALRYCLTSWFWLEAEWDLLELDEEDNRRSFDSRWSLRMTRVFLRMTDGFLLEAKSRRCPG